MIEVWKNLSLENLDGEIWKTIEEFPDYEVSNMGRIKSYKCDKINGKILKPWKNKKGYLCVELNNRSSKLVHVLVLENFSIKLKSNECVHHKDFKKDNNIIKNLINMDRSKHSTLHSKGKIISKETRKLMRENRADVKGENNPMYGKHHTEEWKIKHSKRMKGKNHPMYGKHRSEESKRKQSEKAKEKYLGESSSNNKLTEKDVIEILKDLNEEILTQGEIAKKFGVDRSLISRIKTRKIWKHIKI